MKKDAENGPSRGRGGLGRRETKDLFVEAGKSQDQAADKKAPKRRLFGNVMHRFDRPDVSARGGGDGSGSGGSVVEAGSLESPSDARQRVASGNSKASKTEAASPLNADSAASMSAAALKAHGSEAQEDSTGKPVAMPAGWNKGARNPDRFARFLGKMLGVRDDALPDEPMTGDVGGEDIVGPPGTGAPTDPQGEEFPRTSSSAQQSSGVRASATGGSSTEPRAASGDGGGGDRQSLPRLASVEAQGEGSTTASTTTAAAATSATAEAPPVTATAVYPATAVSTATADALPVAVAVPVTEGTAMGTSAAPPARRSSRSGRAHRTAGARPEGEAPASGVGETVSIMDWVAREQRETGGLVRVFSAQRVLDGRVQKRCRVAVSRKNMTQVRQLPFFLFCTALGGRARFGRGT